MRKLNCPECNKSYSRWTLLIPRWHELCPHCKSKLRLTQKTSLIISLLLIISFIIAYFIIGTPIFVSIRFIAFFILSMLLIAKIIYLIFGEFEKMSDKQSFLSLSGFSIFGISVIIIFVVIISTVIINYRINLPSNLKIPENLKKESTTINFDQITKTLFWESSWIGNITDISFNHSYNQMLGIAGTKGFVLLDRNFNEISHFKFNKCSSYTNIIFTNKNEIYGFINRGSLDCDAGFFDHRGNILWNYKGKTNIFDMSAGDIGSDGKTGFVVGFNGNAGIHLLNNNGKKQWERPERNVWHIELTDANGDGLLDIVHSNADGHIILRNIQGQVINKIISPFYINYFSLARWPGNMDKKYILISNKSEIILLDYEGNIIARFDAPMADVQANVRGAPIKLSSEKNYYFAVVVEFNTWDRSILYIYNFKKDIVYQEVITDKCSSIAALSSEAPDYQGLVIGCSGKIWKYDN